MPYATGNANNATDLVNALTTFCTSNGWTASGGVLSKGSNHFLPSVVSGHVKVEMGTAAGFATGTGLLGANFPYISLNGVFPVFYRLFATSLNGADTVVMCVQEQNALEYKYLMFGNLENKVGAWTGGQWMHATYSSQSGGSTARQSNAGTALDAPAGVPSDGQGGVYIEEYSQAHGALFAFCDQLPNFGSNFTVGNSFVRCDLDGGTIKGNQFGSSTPGFLGCVDAFRMLKLPLRRQPNTWNGESALFPFHVRLGRATETVSRLGNVGHIRAMRMDNYEPGDIITLGLDRWMVMPMYKRDQVEPLGKVSAFNNPAINGHTGQLAYAIKYDGP